MSNQKYDSSGNTIDELIGKTGLNDDCKNGMSRLNFVDLSDRELLLFVQICIRQKNILEKELETIETTYNNELNNIKTDLLDCEEVTKYTTQKERLLMLDKLAEENIDSKYLNKLSKIKEAIDDIKNELDLAREIYRLKNI